MALVDCSVYYSGYYSGMGRPRTFDIDVALDRARGAFVASGYHGTSVDDLLRSTGLFRASLYQAFGSKRGVFMALLQRIPDAPALQDADLDLLLVALMDLTSGDPEVRAVVRRLVRLHLLPDPDARLGHRLLHRLGEPAPVHSGDSGAHRMDEMEGAT